ncbi:tetratricopeptide repeat protein [Peribacillus saganii]|uniref:Tetratricopeptide repeat protein n=1 Tax=Peribacillus saganii TaxID=2303992 RepID=A0A372LKC9_9BACI|nr:tetratricopeptide repeat protein [Peribacillus saganii]RFU66988.1 tetratricopeptide repeat protein [Peribacillus saganii]
MGNDSKGGQQAKILPFHPTGEYYFSKGLKAYHRRDLYKAKKYLERAMALEPNEPMIACQLAITCTEMGEYTYSNNLLENILNVLDPLMAECHYFLANNYAHLGMFKEAYRHANAYLDKEEDGEFSEDAEDLLDLITFETDEGEESFNQEDGLIFKQEKAREYLECGNFEKAIEVLLETIEEYPDFWSAYNNLALAYYYVGQTEEAYRTLDTVLEKSPGNLHALCNMTVFHFYQQRDMELDELVKALAKIRPIVLEQRFKLGATFALVGKYQLAYQWLKQLQKQGFEGDATFFYWLAISAHYLGHEHTAKQAWKRVLDISPDKAGMEPWAEGNQQADGFENHTPSILKRIDSDYAEERLFAIFLSKHSMERDMLHKHSLFADNEKLTQLEQNYIKLLTGHSQGMNSEIEFADRTAELLYKHFTPIQISEAGLFLMWFSLFVEAVNENIKLTNPAAWAAASEYTWNKLRDEKKSQQEIAKKYYISTSTLAKYVKLVNSLLR